MCVFPTFDAVVPDGEHLELGEMSESGADDGPDAVVVEVELPERVEALEVALHGRGEQVARQVQRAQSRQPPQRASAHVRHRRVSDRQRLEARGDRIRIANCLDNL